MKTRIYATPAVKGLKYMVSVKSLCKIIKRDRCSYYVIINIISFISNIISMLLQ